MLQRTEWTRNAMTFFDIIGSVRHFPLDIIGSVRHLQTSLQEQRLLQGCGRGILQGNTWLISFKTRLTDYLSAALHLLPGVSGRGSEEVPAAVLSDWRDSGPRESSPSLQQAVLRVQPKSQRQELPVPGRGPHSHLRHHAPQHRPPQRGPPAAQDDRRGVRGEPGGAERRLQLP